MARSSPAARRSSSARVGDDVARTRRSSARAPPSTTRPGTVHRDHGGRGHDDPRGLDAAPRRRRAPRGRYGREGTSAPWRPIGTDTSRLPASVPRDGSPCRGCAAGPQRLGPSRNLDTDVVRFGRGGADRRSGRRADAAGRRGCCATSRSTGSSCRGARRPGYRVYGLGELNQLRALRELRAPLRRRARRASRSPRGCGASPSCARAVDGWLAAADDSGSWIDWEQRKHERLLAA